MTTPGTGIDGVGLLAELTPVTVLARMGLSMVFGAAIGFERKLADKPADARTMILICTGATAFTLLGMQISADVGSIETTRIDSTRVLSYIISGVGFLGAGAILHSKKSVTGLTTAAAIWAAAAIGAAVGLGQFITAIALEAVVLVTLWMPWVQNLRSDNGASEMEEIVEIDEPDPPEAPRQKPGKKSKGN